MKVPRRISIGAHSYSISYDSKLEERHKKLGLIDITNGIILIEPKQINSAKTDTLLHELLHVINFYYCNRSIDEDYIQYFATGLSNLLHGLGLELDWDDIIEEEK